MFIVDPLFVTDNIEEKQDVSSKTVIKYLQLKLSYTRGVKF